MDNKNFENYKPKVNIEKFDTTEELSDKNVKNNYTSTRANKLVHIEISKKASLECNEQMNDLTQSINWSQSEDNKNHNNVDVKEFAMESKPSYLNLACCVNGYSNITTYDSKIRQDINKSREVSPIRPASGNIQCCKVKTILMPPPLLPMPTIASNTICANLKEKNNGNQVIDNSSEYGGNLSLIQQRVERLYGPGSLSQNFYSPKKTKTNSIDKSNTQTNDTCESELLLKFKEISPKNNNQKILYKLESSTSKVDQNTKIPNDANSVDLPVFRHLSPEFRAQLPIVNSKNYSPLNLFTKATNEIDGKSNENSLVHLTRALEKDVRIEPDSNNDTFLPKSGQTKTKGIEFLNLLRIEQTRLLNMAVDAEKSLSELSANSEISEDVLGVLRSASGKARLLVSQKMKQFEGLCHKNVNANADDYFPTTDDDLQGFWDMINLQINHIDNIFADVNILKQNNWKKTDPLNSNFDAKQKKVLKPSPIQKTSVNGNKKSPAAQKHEAQRKELREMKRKNKMAMASSSKLENSSSSYEATNEIEIYTNENN